MANLPNDVSQPNPLLTRKFYIPELLIVVVLLATSCAEW
jgi:hypothetical protein